MPTITYCNGDGAESPLTADEIFSMLASRRRRYVLHYLHRTRPDATVDDIAEYVAERLGRLEEGDRERLMTELHHSHLPRLSESGLVEYDPETGTVQYRGHPLLEAYLEFVAAHDLLD